MTPNSLPEIVSTRTSFPRSSTPSFNSTATPSSAFKLRGRTRFTTRPGALDVCTNSAKANKVENNICIEILNRSYRRGLKQRRLRLSTCRYDANLDRCVGSLETFECLRRFG